MTPDPKWFPRRGDRMALLNRQGDQIGEWKVAEVVKTDGPDSFTIRLERGDDLA